MNIKVNIKDYSYDIMIERGILNHTDKYLNLNRKVLILTDDGIPLEYVNVVKEKALEPFVYTVKSGEASKCFKNFENIITYLVENGFTRTDCLVAIGGGVVGDLGGFVASCYMRGIAFYNIPTTLLAQVDSSIGGKTAIDYLGYKNIVGSFYQPQKVIIDPDTLKTLDSRLLHAGLVEAIKMALTFDEDLFNLILNSKNLNNDLEEIIIRALQIKKYVVENDEKELNLRKVLNFGHTIGHAIESYFNGIYYHGECVGLGMLYMVNPIIRPTLKFLLEKYDLPTSVNIDHNKLLKYLQHDKKLSGHKLTIIYVEKIGSYEMRQIDIEEILSYLEVK